MYSIYSLLFFIFLLKITYNLSPNNFRCLHCGFLSSISFFNTLSYNYSILDPESNFNDDTKISSISFYLIAYLLFDLKNSLERMDLFIHHILVLFWAGVNFSTGITSFCIANEFISTAYLISDLRKQLIYRIIVILFLRLPIWIITLCSKYYFFVNYDYYHNIFNAFVLQSMILLDFIWLFKYSQKLIRLHP